MLRADFFLDFMIFGLKNNSLNPLALFTDFSETQTFVPFANSNNAKNLLNNDDNDKNLR